jgi:flavorubredoxin
VLEAAPNAQVVTNYTGLLKMSTFAPIPMDRVRLVNPGEGLSLGDREVRAWRPPLYDAPETMGLFDASSGVLFSSDCFGGILDSDVSSADDLSAQELTLAAQKWTAIDAPWVSKLDRSMLDAELDAVRGMDPSVILSGHMPPIQRSIQALLDAVAGGPDAPAFDSIDHETLMAMISRPEV